jgi:hypothetical protein
MPLIANRFRVRRQQYLCWAENCFAHAQAVSKPDEIIDVPSGDADSLLAFQSESEGQLNAAAVTATPRQRWSSRFSQIRTGAIVNRGRRMWAMSDSVLRSFGGRCVACLKSQRARREVLRWSPRLAIFALGIGVGALVTARDSTSVQTAVRVTAHQPAAPHLSSVIGAIRADAPAAAGTTGVRPSIASGASSWPPISALIDDRERALGARGARPRGHRGTLVVTSRPQGARVYVNNTFAGRTPLSMRAQPVGSRALRLTMDGYANWSRAITIVANQATNVSAQLTRSE